MKGSLAMAIAALLLVGATGAATAGDVLWYTGHSGADEGNTNLVAFYTGLGATVDVVPAGLLPDLSSYTLVFICMPGFLDPSDFFTADEKARLNAWLVTPSNRVVPVGDWDGFYFGQAVMNDLLAAIGNPIQFVPGAYDIFCGHCGDGSVTSDPVVDGLSDVCRAYTPTWDPAFGSPVAYPADPLAPGPWIMSNGTDTPCIVGIGDQNCLSDPCGYLLTDPDTQEFARRLYAVTCAGEPESACCLPDGHCTLLTRADCDASGGIFYDGVDCSDIECSPTPVKNVTWGQIKAMF